MGYDLVITTHHATRQQPLEMFEQQSLWYEVN